MGIDTETALSFFGEFNSRSTPKNSAQFHEAYDKLWCKCHITFHHWLEYLTNSENCWESNVTHVIIYCPLNQAESRFHGRIPKNLVLPF